jgi:hypothetical protein
MLGEMADEHDEWKKKHDQAEEDLENFGLKVEESFDR